MNNEQIQIETQGTQPNNFTQIPNMAFYELSPVAYKLIAVYLDMSNTGSIYAKTKTITDQLGVSGNTMKKARQELADRGYIKYQPGKRGKNTTTAKITVMINWMWAENNKRMSNSDSINENSISNSDTPLSNSDTIKQDLYKQEKKAVPPPQNSSSIKRNPDFAIVVQSHEQWFGAITSGIADKLNLWLEDYRADWICDALEESALNNVRKLNYAKAILERWAIDGKNDKIAPETKASWLDAGNAKWGGEIE